MKKLTIIFGGSIDYYDKNMGVFKEIGDVFGCSIKKIAKSKLTTKIKKINIEILFAYNPTRDKNYRVNKRYLETKWGQTVPAPADEIVKKIKKSDIVLFFGHCGGFSGKPGIIYTPETFKEIFFEEAIVKHKEIIKIKPKNKIKINNILAGKMQGKKATLITSNLTLNPSSIENNSKEHLIKLAKILSNAGDIVEKESYPVAKYFKDKVPLGVMVVCSDVLSIKKYMMDEKFNPSPKKFSKACIKAIKIALKKLK